MRIRRPMGLLAGGLPIVAGGLLLLNSARWVDGAVGMWVGRDISNAVREAPDGEVIDLAQVSASDWDRMVWVGAYQAGSDGNEGLGFPYYGESEMLAAADGRGRLLFVKGTDVLAEVELRGIGFEEAIAAFAREDARFIVHHHVGTWLEAQRRA